MTYTQIKYFRALVGISVNQVKYRIENASRLSILQRKVGVSFKNVILANLHIKYFRGLAGISVN